MTRTSVLLLLIVLAGAGTVTAQQADINASINGRGGKPALAVASFRGTGPAQPLMSTFDSTLFSDLQGSALFDMKAKSLFPLNNPQTPQDLRAEDNRQGYALQDWAGPPVNASHLVFGYGAGVNGVFVIYGYLYDTRQSGDAAQLLSKRYVGSMDEAGATKTAHEFASDIIQRFGGGASLLGTRIYFCRRSGENDEIWVMDWDGKNPKQLSHLNSMSLYPGVSPDGSRVAFTTWAKGQPRIAMLNTENGRTLPFYNQEASVNASATFTPDGKQIYYSSTAAGIAQIYAAGLDGQNFRRITRTNAIATEPKVNPKNPNVLLFVGGTAQGQQIYSMNADGTGVERVTNGEGEAANPSWSPDGQHITFSWTRGYATGGFNVFVMDVGTKQYIQLTHSEGKNENPVWAPDGKHIVFMSNRSGREQIYTMLADGSQVTQLTQQGVNRYPVWGSK